MHFWYKYGSHCWWQAKTNEFARNYRDTKLGGKTPKVLYQYFATEEELIRHFFTKILPNVPAIAGWNSYNFDWRYMVNRVKVLFGQGEMYNLIRKASPTGDITNITYTDAAGLHYRLPSPMHVANLDYMELVKQYDYILRPYESYSLDWVGTHAVMLKRLNMKVHFKICMNEILNGIIFIMLLTR